MTRVVIIGIDGLDADLLRVYGPSLPHLRRSLMLESPFLELKSSFPPETATAWASIYTGLNPANHGILNSVSVLGDAVVNTMAELKIPRGETFWDIAGRAGKRVCVLNPLLAYPAWPVHGVMLSQAPADVKGQTVFSPSGFSVTPEGAAPAGSFPLLPLLPITTNARQLRAFYLSMYTLTSQQAEGGLELFQREPWDIFFLQLNTLDLVQHVLWRFSDPGDPTYPGLNEFAGHLHHFYRLIDQIVGRFRSVIEEDCIFIVVSGHGQGRRCIHNLNLNEWLRSHGFLTPRMGSMRLLDRQYLTERVKHRSQMLLARLHVWHGLPQISHFSSLARKQYLTNKQAQHHSQRMIDKELTVAEVVEVAGKSPFAGITLNRACIERKGDDYEQVRELLLQGLTQLRLKGRPVVNWAETRERIYQGQYIGYYPDILFELRSDFGISDSMYMPLTTSDFTHQVISGDHRMHGIFLLGNAPEGMEFLDETQEPTVMDVAPTVLRLVDVISPNRDGMALVLPCTTKLPT